MLTHKIKKVPISNQDKNLFLFAQYLTPAVLISVTPAIFISATPAIFISVTPAIFISVTPASEPESTTALEQYFILLRALPIPGQARNYGNYTLLLTT